MIAPKNHTTVSFLNNEDAITTWSFDSSNQNSTPSLSETSTQLRESVEDLRQQIATLQSTVVDLQNAIAATSSVRSPGASWTSTILNSFTKFIVGGTQTGTNWNILEWYHLILFTSVVLVLLSTLSAEYGGYIEPRDDIKIGYALGVLFIGGLLLRASSLYPYVKRHICALRH